VGGLSDEQARCAVSDGPGVDPATCRDICSGSHAGHMTTRRVALSADRSSLGTMAARTPRSPASGAPAGPAHIAPVPRRIRSMRSSVAAAASFPPSPRVWLSSAHRRQVSLLWLGTSSQPGGLLTREDRVAVFCVNCLESLVCLGRRKLRRLRNDDGQPRLASVANETAPFRGRAPAAATLIPDLVRNVTRQEHLRVWTCPIHVVRQDAGCPSRWESFIWLW
jgi:hypothetical protein